MKPSSFIAFLAKKCLLAVLILSLIQIVSCKKGDTGPAGVAGPAGPAGPVGSANTQYSDWFTPPSYTKDTVFGIYGFYYNKAVSALTQPILDSGTVLTFGKLDGYNPSIWPTAQVESLPILITYLNGSAANIDTWSALVTPGNLKIRLTSSTNAYGSISTAHQFRYIIIPGGVKVNGSAHPGQTAGTGTTQVNSEESNRQEVISNYSQMSYTQICKLLNIPE